MSLGNCIGGYISDLFFLEIESQTGADGYGERLVRTECFDGAFVQGIGDIRFEIDADHWNDIDLDTNCTVDTKEDLSFMESFISHCRIDAFVHLHTGSEIEIEMFPVHCRPVKSDRYSEIMYILPVFLAIVGCYERSSSQ